MIKIKMAAPEMSFLESLALSLDIGDFMRRNLKRYVILGEKGYIGHGPHQRSVQIRPQGDVHEIRVRDRYEEERLSREIREFYTHYGFKEFS